MKHQFRNDYSELAHINIIKAYEKLAYEQNVGYGLDYHSLNASNKIKEIFDCKDASVHFLVGGTQTNMTVISYICKDYEGVIACSTGHINVHETGAVEGSGHKVYTVKGVDGKITPDEIIEALKVNCNEHYVKMKMVYISESTEIGTIYSLSELKAIYKVCKDNGLYLFIDGARLATALTSEKNDINIKDIAKYCDVFYIGGTKNGLMIGEALVITNKDLQADFRYQIKNKGAMLAKGFVCGIEFEEIFKDDLYFKLARNSNEMASILKKELLSLGYDVADSPTNQLFVTMDKDKANILMNEFGCEFWEEVGNKLTIRFVTSFNTKKEDVMELIDFVKELK